MAVGRNPAAQLTIAGSLLIAAVAGLIVALSKAGVLGSVPASSGLSTAQVIETANAAARDAARDEVGKYFESFDARLADIQKSLAGIPNMNDRINGLENRLDEMTKKPTGRLWEAIDDVRKRQEALERKVPGT